MHAAGKSEVPSEFHVWACLSLLAACVADRVYLAWLRDRPLYPNMYTFLVAPSGIGKDRAVEFAMQFVSQEDWIEKHVNVYQGKLTAPYLLDLLGKQIYNKESGKYEIVNSKIWFVTPELSPSLGKGLMADALIETMTALFGGLATIKDGTRMHGGITVKNACINWFAGTTEEWLIKALGQDAILSGFFARVMAVIVGEQDNRHWATEYPKDYEEVVKYLKTRVQALCMVEGEFELTEEADAYGKQWFYNRKEPDEKLLKPSWRREKEYVFKLAMLLSLADGLDLKIQWMHMEKAIQLMGMVRQGLPELIELVSQTPLTMAVKKVSDFIYERKEVERTMLGRRLHKYGIDRFKLDNAISTLTQWGCIAHERTPTGAIIYKWRERRY